MDPLPRPVKRLVQAILVQAVKDAVRSPKRIAKIRDRWDRREVRLARQDAQQLFHALDRAGDLRWLCEASMVDYGAVLEQMLRGDHQSIATRLEAAIHAKALPHSD